MKLTCTQCGIDFKNKHPDQKFCSRDCMGKARLGSYNPNWKGGCARPDGYLLITVNGVQMLEHRHLMEQFLGRTLKAGETVHHVDGDRKNNMRSNLKLVASQSEHMKEHAGYRSDTRKQCSKCLEIKDRSEFYLNRTGGSKRDAHRPSCAACVNKARANQRSRVSAQIAR